MAKSVVFVIGASGIVGTATVSALSSLYADQVDIRAGVRNPEKADKLKGLGGVTLVAADMGGDRDELVATLRGVDALFIVTPKATNRAELAISAAEAARDAGVKFVLALSVATADLTDTIFGAQFSKLEKTISGLRVTYSFLRLTFFIDNYLRDTIKKQSTIYGPVDPEKPFTPVLIADLGKAAAAVLAGWRSGVHDNQIYTIASDRHTFSNVAAAFSEALGRQVKYVRVPYETVKQSILQAGFPDWQADGILEVYKLIDSGSSATNIGDLGDYAKITGEKPNDLRAWIAGIKESLQ